MTVYWCNRQIVDRKFRNRVTADEIAGDRAACRRKRGYNHENYARDVPDDVGYGQRMLAEMLYEDDEGEPCGK